MTTASRSDQLAIISSELCTCPLCQKILKLPRILDCFHTFCSHCLEQYIEQQVAENGLETLRCPVCSSSTILPEHTSKSSLTEGIKLDTFVSKLSEVLEAFKDDKMCDICQSQGVHLAASDWCVNCIDAFCLNCTKVHLCGKTTHNHVIISLSELQKLSLQNVMRRCSYQSCDKHQDDLLKLYCLDCGHSVCVQCLTTSHNKCAKCIPVSDALNLVQDDVASVMVRLHTVMTGSNNKDTSSRNRLTRLEENISQTEAEIRSLAEDLRCQVSLLEETLIAKLHSVGSQLLKKTREGHNATKSHENDIKTLASAKNRLTALLKYGSDIDILDIYHSVKDTLSEVESSSTLSDTALNLKVNFDIDETVKNFCRSLKTLGDVRVEDSACDEGLSSWGVTVTSREEIVVVDGRHKRVQKFSSSGSLIDHIQLSEEPRDITSFGQHDVAITIMRKQILVVAAAGNMDLRRRIDTQRQYDSIAFYPMLYCFLVSSLEDNCIDVISTKGDIIKTFNVAASTKEPIFSSPRYVSFTKEGYYVVSDSTLNSVTCISRDGSLLFSYQPQDGTHSLKKAQGVCCDKNSNIFVADYGNSRIHLLTSEGSFQRFILGQESELIRPVALAMTESNKLVVVQSDGMVKIFTYEGNKAQGEDQDIPNGKMDHSHRRFSSNSSPGLYKIGKSGRSLSDSSDIKTAISTLSPHTFRSRHF